MNQVLPAEYIQSKFYELAGFPKFIKGSGDYRASCPTCREGKSWGKKRRLNYVPDKGFIHCFNCNKTWNPINWIIEQSGLTFQEVMEESKDYDFSTFELTDEKFVRPESETLPQDSINLFDKQQVTYFIDEPVIKDCLKLIRERRLNTAVNRPKALYVSLKDFIHKNRLVLPFYDYRGKVAWYQTRAMYAKDEKDRPKYMSKLNSERSVFGLDKINGQIDYIFIFEGPIDSMFVKNGVAMGGISMSDKQQEQMSRFSLHEKIWVLDNEFHSNKDVKRQATKLVEAGERVFFWPRKYRGLKDVNELCVKVGKDSIRPEFFVENSFQGLEALNKLSTI